MTRRGLVFGNSHGAALRLAWRNGQAKWPGLTLEFAAASGDSMASFVVQDSRLTATEQAARDSLMALNGRNTFDLGSYDFFLICSGTPSMFHAVHLYRAAGIAAFAGGVDAPRVLMSRAGFQAALVGVMQGMLGHQLAGRLAGMGKPCFVMGHPRLSVAAKADAKTYAGFMSVGKNRDAEMLAALFEAAAREAFAGLATYLPQPQHTVEDHLFTADIWRRGAIRLTPGDNVAQPAQDYLHANGDYGALMIDALTAALS